MVYSPNDTGWRLYRYTLTCINAIWLWIWSSCAKNDDGLLESGEYIVIDTLYSKCTNNRSTYRSLFLKWNTEWCMTELNQFECHSYNIKRYCWILKRCMGVRGISSEILLGQWHPAGATPHHAKPILCLWLEIWALHQVLLTSMQHGFLSRPPVKNGLDAVCTDVVRWLHTSELGFQSCG